MHCRDAHAEVHIVFVTSGSCSALRTTCSRRANWHANVAALQTATADARTWTWHAFAHTSFGKGASPSCGEACLTTVGKRRSTMNDYDNLPCNRLWSTNAWHLTLWQWDTRGVQELRRLTIHKTQSFLGTPLPTLEFCSTCSVLSAKTHHPKQQTHICRNLATHSLDDVL